MSPTRRQMLLLILLAVLLGALGFWAYGRFDSARSAAITAWQDAQACDQLAQRIAQARHKPDLAGADEIETSVLVKQLEAAAKKANLPSAAIVRVWPEPARRLGDSVYKEKTTQIVLRNVTLQQATGLLSGVSLGSRNLYTKSLRITAPRDSSSGSNTWAVEAVIAYLVYSPPANLAERDDRGI